MTAPSSTYEWVALAGATVAAICLLVVVVLAVKIRRMRAAQSLVMGGERRDLVGHAEALQSEFAVLRDWLDEATAKIEARMHTAEERLDGAVAHTAMIRYDAYGEMSGRQSSSIALLNAHKSGVVLSAILHRSHSHLYVKQIVEGDSDIDLSPEEQQVIDRALSAAAPVKTKA